MPLYLFIFLLFVILSYIVQNNLSRKFKAYAKIPLVSGMTGREVAEKMLREHGITNVQVTCTEGFLTDPPTAQ